MAKVNIKFKAKVEKLENELYKKKYITQIADFAMKLLYNRVKEGYGVQNDSDPDTKKQKLKKLSKSYISFREGKVKFYTGKQGQVYPVNQEASGFELRTAKSGRQSKRKIFDRPPLGPFASPRFSNLTFSGQLLESIEKLIRRNNITMRIPNSRRSDGKRNAEVAEWVRKERPFFALTIDEKKVIIKEWKKIVQKVLNSK